MWLTNKKTGKVFNTDWINDDAVRKERQINATKEQSKKLNAESGTYNRIKHHYANYTDPYKMRDEFFNKTNITISNTLLKKCNTQSLGAVLDTVSQLRDEYKFILEKIEPVTDGDDSVVATMGSNGTLSLNADYWSKSWDEISESYSRNVATKHHPKGDGHSWIVHEIGHSILNYHCVGTVVSKEQVTMLYGDMVKHADAIHLFLAGNEDKKIPPGRYDNNVANESAGYRRIASEIYDLEDKLNNSAYLKKYIGSHKYNLLGFANPDMIGSAGISTYAGKTYHEAVAEAFADVYMNKAKASYISKKLYEAFIRGYKK